MADYESHISELIDSSESQAEVEQEAWNNYGAFDFRRYLTRVAPHHEMLFDTIPNELLHNVWQTLADTSNIDACYVAHDSAYFPFPDVFGDRGSNRAMMWPITRKTILAILEEYRDIHRSGTVQDGNEAS